MNNKWHILSLEQIVDEFNTDLKNGLSMSRARTKLSNEIKEQNGKRKYLFSKSRPSVFKCIIGVFTDPLMILLLVVALLSFIFGNSLAGLLTLIVAVVCCAMCAVMSYISDKRLSMASDYSSPMIRAIRGGEKYYTDGRNAVKGDVLELTEGDLLPCDARIISGELLVKEIIYTASGIKNRTVEKRADINYSAEESISAPNAQNMLYAGTAILSGAARAVVVSTGNDVYLSKYLSDGELSGASAQISFERELKPWMQKIRLISICAVVLLTLLSLLTDPHGAIMNSFLLILSLAVLLSADILNIGSRYITSSYIYKLSQEKKKSSKRSADLSAVIKSPAVQDKLADITKLVIIGRAGLTDGAFHISETYAADSVLQDLNADTTEGNRLLTFIYTYVKTLQTYKDENNAVSGDIAEALLDHVKNSDFDCDAADIFIRSLYYVNDGKRGYACAETADSQFRVALTFDDDILDYCERIRHTDGELSLTEQDIHNAKSFCLNAQESGAKCLYIVSEHLGVATLEGVVALKQAATSGFAWTVSEFERLGIETKLFLNRESDINLLPDLHTSEMYNGRIAMSSTYRGVDISSEYKKYEVLAGFSREDYAAIIEQMRKNGDKVAVFSIDNKNNPVAAYADVSITCDNIKYDTDKYKASAYEKLPAVGDDSSTRSTSQTRLFSGVVLKRAHSGGGGIAALLNAVKTSRMSALALCTAVEFCVLIMSSALPFALLSIILGTTFIDAFQMLSIGAVAIFLPFLMLSERDYKADLISLENASARHPIKTVIDRFPSMIARASVSTLVCLVVFILKITKVFGNDPGFSFAIYIALLLTLFAEIILFHKNKTQKGEGRSRRWMKLIIAYAAILLLCGMSTQTLFAEQLYPNGIGTFEFLIVPIYLALYVAAIFISRSIEIKRNLK